MGEGKSGTDCIDKRQAAYVGSCVVVRLHLTGEGQIYLGVNGIGRTVRNEHAGNAFFGGDFHCLYNFLRVAGKVYGYQQIRLLDLAESVRIGSKTWGDGDGVNILLAQVEAAYSARIAEERKPRI